MTCPRCGNALSPDARFCKSCGAQVVAAPMSGAYYATPGATGPAYAQPWLRPYARVASHLHVLSILWFCWAGYRAFTGLLGMAFMHAFLHIRDHSNWGEGGFPFGHTDFAYAWLPFAMTALMVGIALAVLTGYALHTRQPWGRIFAIVIAILALFHPLLGTALGIYTLWVLAPRASGLEYEAMTATRTGV